jgi:5S rRNA maturation endonuclease (ribonuclease M5)
MTVKIDDEHASVLKCHACRYRRTLAEGLSELNVHLEGGITRIVDYVKTEDGKADISFTRPPGADHEVTTDYTAELRTLQQKPFPDKAAAFLKEKGCTVAYARNMHCAWIDRYEATNAMGEKYVIEDAILFPAIIRRDEQLICVGAQAREVEGKTWRSKYLTPLQFSSGLYLFGEHLLHLYEGKTLFVVEGPLDAMHLLEQGFPTVGVFGLYLSGARKEKIKRAMPKRVILLPDPDSPGREASDRMVRQFKEADINCRIADTGKDPKTLTPDDINEITWRKNG